MLDVIRCNEPPSTPNGHIIHQFPINSKLEVGASVTYVLQSRHQLGHQSVCTEVNVTAVCNREGKWETLGDNTCSEVSGKLACDCSQVIASSMA